MLVLQMGFQQGGQRLTSCLFEPEFLGNGGNDQFGTADGSEGNEAHAVGKVTEHASRYLQPYTCFANPTWASERQQAHFWLSQEGTGRCYDLLAPNQRSELDRQVVFGGLPEVGGIVQEEIRGKRVCLSR